MPAPLAHSVKDAQELFDHFVTSAHCFGLKGSLKKTEIMPQLVWKEPSTPVITAAGAVLKAVDKFCYLGGVLSPSSNVDYDIFTRLAKASAAFGKLTKHLRNNHVIKLHTKVGVYQAVVLNILLYGSESWTIYRRHVLKCDQFHVLSEEDCPCELVGQNS